MDHTGEYQLAIQIGHRGFYAHVWLTVSTDPSSDSLKTEVSRDVRQASSAFQAAIQSGIEWVWWKCRDADPQIGGLLVRVVRLHSMVVDSTPRCVRYAAAGALLRALGMEKLLPPFEPNQVEQEP